MSNKIITRYFGGLGNQLFQYSSCLTLQKSLAKETILLADLSWFHQKHKSLAVREYDIMALIEDSIQSLNWFEHLISWLGRRRLLRLWPFSLIAKEIRKNPSITRDKVLEMRSDCYYMNGYFQDVSPTNYSISRIRQIISTKISEQKKMLEDKFNLDNNCIVIHVRRGDFVSIPSASQIHNVCSDKYYMNAIAQMRNLIHTPRFFLITDDPEYCRYRYGEQAIIITNSTNLCQNYTVNDFLTMCCFDNHIISNSSFSWWAAVLAESQNTIIPSKWYNTSSNFDPSHYSPSCWVRLDV
jgi:hypothetical protein